MYSEHWYWVPIIFTTVLATGGPFLYLFLQKNVEARLLKISAINERLMEEVSQQEKFKAIAALASGVAHEIKNPLTAITSFAEFLPSKRGDEEFFQKFSKIIPKEVGRINDLVHQLLDLGRENPLSLKKCDIHQLISEILDVLSSRFIESKIKISVNFYAQKILLNIDPSQIKQVLLNLLLNAIDAIGTEGNISISTNCINNQFEICIEDS